MRREAGGTEKVRQFGQDLIQTNRVVFASDKILQIGL